MAITLETIAAPGATPIANNAASAKSFANDYYKLAVPNLSTRDRLTILILALIYRLNTAGGANYKLSHGNLIQDSVVYTGGISAQFDIWSALAATSWSGANALDATLSTDIPTLLKEGRDLDNLSEDQLFRIIAFLAAQLGF